MRRRLCAALLALCLLLTACGCDSNVETSPAPSAPAPDILESVAPDALPTPELSQRERDWVEDFHDLKEQLLKHHPNPFFLCTEEEFDWKLDQLVGKLSTLSDHDIYFELSAIVSGLGDSHTYVSPSDDLYDPSFPVNTYYFGEKLYLCGYIEGYEHFAPYLLREIVAVNEVDITYLRKKCESIWDPSNSWRSKELFALYPAFVDWASHGGQQGYTFQILNENREVESVAVPTISRKDFENAAMVFPENFQSIFYLGGGNWARYFQEDAGGYVYMSFADMKTMSRMLIQQLFEETAEVIQAHPDCGKLIIDLRSNHGGSLEVQNYVREFVTSIKIAGQTYVLTGGTTASAAIGLISIFQEELNAITVGEPTGQFTTTFGYRYVPTVFLPHSRLKVYIATGWWNGTELLNDLPVQPYEEWQYTILPDVFVPQDIEDVRQGRDSVIQWVLAQ